MEYTYYLFISKLNKKVKSIQKLSMINNGIKTDIQNELNTILIKYKTKKSIEEEFFKLYKLNMWEHIYNFQYPNVTDIDIIDVTKFIQLQTIKVNIFDQDGNLVYTEQEIQDKILYKIPKILLPINTFFKIKISIYDPDDYLKFIPYLDINEINYNITVNDTDVNKIDQETFGIIYDIPCNNLFLIKEKNLGILYQRKLNIKFSSKIQSPKII